MRLFVAVELGEHVRRVAEATADVLRTALDSRITARWIPLENLHVTVRFIGHVPDDRAPAVISTVVAPLAARPFDIRLGACGVFPRSGPPRVIWIGVEEGLSSLASIHEELNRRLAPLGFEPEERPFSAHLTLARIKDVRGAAKAIRQAVTAVEPRPARCRVTHATLFQSRLSPAGSRYEALERIELTYP